MVTYPYHLNNSLDTEIDVLDKSYHFPVRVCTQCALLFKIAELFFYL